MTNKEKAMFLAIQIKEEVGLPPHSIQRTSEIILEALNGKDYKYHEYLDRKIRQHMAKQVHSEKEDLLYEIEREWKELDFNDSVKAANSEIPEAEAAPAEARKEFPGVDEITPLAVELYRKDFSKTPDLRETFCMSIGIGTAYSFLKEWYDNLPKE